MAIPSTPSNFLVQQGNAQVWVTCDLVSGATSYPVYRSTDNVSFSEISAPAVPQYLDTTATAEVQYYYKIAARNGDGTSSHTASQGVVPVQTGDMTLGQIRLQSQQRADRVNSNFLTVPEWNTNINQSAFELYDLLTTVFEDWYVRTPWIFQTDGSTQRYQLPNGVVQNADGSTPQPFYKLSGVDLALTPNQDSWVTVKKFQFVERNRYVYPQLTSTYLGVFNMRYRLVGDTLMFIPTPSAGQYIRVWYYPRMQTLLKDTDVIKGVSGWTEYVIVDAAIKALQKEESDTSVLMAQKMALIKRIEEAASNRDVGEADRISDVRSFTERWGYNGYGGGSDGGWAGF